MCKWSHCSAECACSGHRSLNCTEVKAFEVSEQNKHPPSLLNLTCMHRHVHTHRERRVLTLVWNYMVFLSCRQALTHRSTDTWMWRSMKRALGPLRLISQNALMLSGGSERCRQLDRPWVRESERVRQVFMAVNAVVICDPFPFGYSSTVIFCSWFYSLMTAIIKQLSRKHWNSFNMFPQADSSTTTGKEGQWMQFNSRPNLAQGCTGSLGHWPLLRAC